MDIVCFFQVLNELRVLAVVVAILTVTVPVPRGRRVGIDPALYTWKGYRNWSEQVKRNWHPEPGDDAE